MPSIEWLAVWLIVISAMIALGFRDVRRDRRKSRADDVRRAARLARFEVVEKSPTVRSGSGAPATAGDLGPGLST